ncbi:MAG: hypothetical protein ACXWWX_04220 [Actinomycetota bacterium]
MDDLQRRAALRAAIAAAVVLLVGITSVFGIEQLREEPGEVAGSPSVDPSATGAPPDAPAEETWLAWVPGGIPEGVGPAITTVPVITQATTATSDIAWLERSLDASSVVVDDPPEPYMIPLDVTGVEPTYASFVPAPQRPLIENLLPGQGILSESAAAFRELGEDATLTFDTGASVTVVGTLPDTAMGGHELLVTKGTGEDLGVTTERYILFRVRPGASPSVDRLAAEILPLLPVDARYPYVEVRAPGTTRWLRANDRELPLIALKRRFGEFAALPDATGTGAIQVDPAWIDARLVTQDLPVLGTVTCNRKAIRSLAAAMEDVEAAGPAAPVTDHGECFVPSLEPDDPSGLLTAADFGAAIELNRRTNRPGNPPDQSEALVDIMFANGYSWGGRDAWPQGALFRYRKLPRPGT